MFVSQSTSHGISHGISHDTSHDDMPLSPTRFVAFVLVIYKYLYYEFILILY